MSPYRPSPAEAGRVRRMNRTRLAALLYRRPELRGLVDLADVLDQAMRSI